MPREKGTTREPLLEELGFEKLSAQEMADRIGPTIAKFVKEHNGERTTIECATVLPAWAFSFDGVWEVDE